MAVITFLIKARYSKYNFAKEDFPTPDRVPIEIAATMVSWSPNQLIKDITSWCETTYEHYAWSRSGTMLHMTYEPLFLFHINNANNAALFELAWSDYIYKGSHH